MPLYLTCTARSFMKSVPGTHNLISAADILNTSLSREETINSKELFPGIRLFIKRDDLIHPIISGNKYRKLLYNLDRAVPGSKGICTFGGAYSNHLVATACAGAMMNVPTHGVVRGEELNKGSNQVLQLCSLYGMTLEFVSRHEYADKPSLESRFQKQGYLVVPEGGNNEEGRRGCEAIIEELSNAYDFLAVSVGTGTTYAGILKAIRRMGLSLKAEGFCAMKGGEYLEDKIRLVVSEADICLHTEFHYGGFGKWDTVHRDFMHRFHRLTGILPDPVYTGKMFRGISELCSQGYYPANSRVLAIHTGGLTGWFGPSMQ